MSSSTDDENNSEDFALLDDLQNIRGVGVKTAYTVQFTF